ncbi:MAG: circularly permuted type 2 ATP-grasp protein [Bdellovibrionota bacterium]
MRFVLGSTMKLMMVTAIMFGSISFGLAGPQDEVRYNEVFDENGQVRPSYQKILPAWASRVHHMTDYERKTYLEIKRGNLDSNAINDLPRMIMKSEYDVIEKGVHQRERAIQAFLKDHYSGTKAYAKRGIVSEALVNEIIIRNGEDGYRNVIDVNTPMNFLYGPDLIRGPDGVMRALEDNIGFVGGFGDIVIAQEITERLYPEIKVHYRYPKAIEWYRQLLTRYSQQAEKFGGKVVMYSDPNITDDSEDKRTNELFEKLGVEVITPTSERRLVFEAGGVYAQGPKGEGREKVGFIVQNIEHADGDLAHPAALEKAILDAAAGFIADKKGRVSKKLRGDVLEALMSYDPVHGDKTSQLANLKYLLRDTAYRVNLSEGSKRAKGLVDAILEGRVGSSYSPGAEFVGDKQMYTHIESFIRFYLNEEPIIKNVETYMFNVAGTQEVDEKVLDKVFGEDRKGRDLKNWVIKPVDGRGGDGIIFGADVRPEQIPAIIERIKESPQRKQVQRNTPPSVMTANRIIDMRPLTYSTRESAIVTPVPWSRSATADKSKLINVSSGGAVNGVFIIRPKPGKCTELFSAAN